MRKLGAFDFEKVHDQYRVYRWTDEQLLGTVERQGNVWLALDPEGLAVVTAHTRDTAVKFLAARAETAA